MAAPTAPTQTSLATEGLKQGGTSNPSSTDLTRAYGWMEEVKNDLTVFWGGKKLKALYVTAFMPLTEGKSRYPNPTDYLDEMSVTLVHGVHFDTAQAGAVGTITLASGEDIGATTIIGREILITGGTGAGSCSQVTAYDSSTKVATVTPDFTTAPAAASTYMVIDDYETLEEGVSWDLKDITQQTRQGKPSHFYPIGDADDGEFILWPVPYTTDSQVYGVRMRYYADMGELDLTGTTVSTLYKKFQNLWIQGVKTRSLEDRKQTEAQSERAKYNAYLERAVANELYGHNISNLQMRIAE